MAEKKTNSFFKRLVGFLHFLFACVTLVGIGFMYLNSNYGRGLDWIKTETFEQSPDFSKKVQADITNIFDYVSIRIFLNPTARSTTPRSFWKSPRDLAVRNPILWTILSSTENPWATTWTSPTTTR